MPRKTYFRMPDFDCPPDSNVQLGQIITSPKHPYGRLAPPHTPIPGVSRSTKHNYQDVVSRARKGEIGLWMQSVASILGVGGDIQTSWLDEQSHVFEFRELETVFFEPGPEYLADSLKTTLKALDYIRRNPRKSIYMITGLKIARGAKCAEHAARGCGFDLKVSVDATPFVAVPVQGGPAFKTETLKGRGYSFDDADDFVYAYRMRRIIVTYKGNIKSDINDVGGGTMGHRDGESHSGTGGDLGRGDDEEEEKGGEMELDFENMYLDDTDYGSNGVPFEASSNIVTAEDDDHDTNCVLITLPPTKQKTGESTED